MDKKVKPCPSCGNEVTMVRRWEGNDSCYWVIKGGREKNQCRCRIYMESDIFDYDDVLEGEKCKQKLITMWNRRV